MHRFKGEDGGGGGGGDGGASTEEVVVEEEMVGLYQGSARQVHISLPTYLFAYIFIYLRHDA